MGIGPYRTYNFLTSNAKFLPYAGAQLSIFAVSETNLNSLGIYGGSKYFLPETLNIDGGLSLLQGLDDYTGTIVTARIGIGVVIGKLN